MHPITHLAVGYLCYSLYCRWSDDKAPGFRLALMAVFGAVLPDVIDKPLEWWGIVDVGRTLGHSLLFAVPSLRWLICLRGVARGSPSV